MKRSEKSQQKKEELIKLAEAGEKRPSTKSELGRALNNYTTRGGNSHDMKFEALIKSLRKDWFRNAESKSVAE